ncbi:Putative aminotransferase [Kitasatospora sp. MMS16-BH015]|uniref:class-III pyridoxal-phosphate-dependent aminotransferase n=1 Tax=Kitasatospora sp. MMS16-BH015 TaxID=2018025 RepID=UPI000CA1DAC1|nr:aspartate aminotransferase family protein [Kitasatospora sp. MMS16-BH015]AUG80519.1 Putative aminotransferase [Kitasatospora sp. MMS16-BH015]
MTPGALSERVVAQESAHLGHGLSTAATLPAALVSGKGVVVHDLDGRRYLDLFGGAGRCLLGHGDEAFTRALADQARSLVVSRHAHPVRARYAAELVSLAPSGLDHLSLVSTGSEAVDCAVRIARAATGRDTVLVFEGAFHGRTTGVADFTDPRWHPGPRGHHPVVRCPYPTEQDDPAARRLAAEAVRSALAGRTVAAVLIEPVQGSGGNRACPPAFLRTLAELCAATGSLLLLDEVVTGFGRTGAVFAATAAGVRPDLLILGKGMANGVPIGAVLTSSALAATPPLGLPGGMSSTFGGNPLAVAAAAVTLDLLLGRELAEQAAVVGTQWRRLLSEALAGHPAVASVHGTGLQIGVRLRHAADERAFLEAGLVVGTSGDTVRLNPPLVLSHAQADEATERIVRVLGRATTRGAAA